MYKFWTRIVISNGNIAVVIGTVLIWLQLQITFAEFALFVGVFCGFLKCIISAA